MDSDISAKTDQQYADTEIISKVLSGSIAMFEIIIRRYNPYLYKIGRCYGFNHQDIEDLMQETFISSYINLKQFAHRSSFKTWLIKIMVNQCYHKIHKYSYRNEKSTEVLPANSSFVFLNNNSTDNGNKVFNKEFNKVVEACLQKLPQNYRTTFTLRELTGFSIAETAELMRTTSSNVKVRLNRAKELLRKEIMKTYTPEDIYEFNLIYCDRIVDVVMKKVYEL